jgi:hypothetical protein
LQSKRTLTPSRISDSANTCFALVLAFTPLFVLSSNTASSFGDWTVSIDRTIKDGSGLVNGDSWDSERSAGEKSRNDDRDLHLE